jgi:hypothetical protein
MVRSTLDDGPNLRFQETETWKATYPGSGTLSDSRHCAFCSRALAGSSFGRKSSVFGGWMVLRLANFGAPMQNGFCQNGFRDWQSRGTKQIENPGRPRGARGPATVARAERSYQEQLRKQKPPSGFFSSWCVQLQAKSFPVASWQGQVRVLLTDLRYLASISTVNSMLCCSEILRICIMLLVRAAMHPEADVDFCFLCVDVSSCSTAKQHVMSLARAENLPESLACQMLVPN